MSRAKNIVAVLISSLFLAVAPALARPSSSTAKYNSYQSVENFTAKFLKSFENLDLDTFIACFSQNATVFFPTPEPPQRFNGKSSIREHFSKVFEGIRKNSHASSPPYHRLVPQHMEVKILSNESALVTFELENDQRIARRTLVLSKHQNNWLIEHLHASNVTVQP